jgi:cation diffusion facilitator CzcD-associated flavoprotein CzcO
MTGDKPWPQVPVGNKDHTSAAVVIIGAGISGLCTAISLLQSNPPINNIIIIEKSTGLGGTWRDNKYPGCCCDVWSHLYSFSFEQNSAWTREYPGQEEILRYLVSVAAKYNIWPLIRFGTQVETMTWDELTKKWDVAVRVTSSKDAEFGEDTINTDYVVSAVGQLNVPRMPDIEGLDEFKGKVMHSARWDWGYSLKNKKVAIIGNGATAAQIIPEIVKEVGSLTVHQRTPNWIIPRADAPISGWKRSLYKWVPPVRWRKRSDMMDFREAFYDAVTDNESAFAKMLEDSHRVLMKSQLVGREELWKQLEPNYKVGCKRVIIR